MEGTTIETADKKLGVPQAIIIAGLIIAGAIFLTNGTVSLGQKGAAPLPSADITVKSVSADDHVRGNAKARVVIIEFSDLECPFCKVFHPTIAKFTAENDVAWVYRHFPLDSLHSKARKEAEATECAAELGGNDAFWRYTDRLFDITPANNGLDASELPKIATTVGLDVAAFNACLASGKYADKIEAQFQDGRAAGVTGTPSSVVMNVKTGKKVRLIGAESYENIKRAVDSVK